MKNPGTDWRPSAPLPKLQSRARIFQQIRQFFADRKVMEVDTPLLCHTSVTDPFIQSIPGLFQGHPTAAEQRYYLQTSPEYCMKRLLAAGSGDIYQLGKAFRQGEVGRFHNPEFAMLEWYRLGFDHHKLMDEMDELLQTILGTDSAERKSYVAIFKETLDIDPLSASVDELSQLAAQLNINLATAIHDKDTWLQLLMSEYIELQIGKDKPCFIYDFPASQAALARLNPVDARVASRFEVYFRGMELANGFHELQNAQEQRKRFEKNVSDRKSLALYNMPIDEYFLAALEHGLPDCAGVALGVDRLIMLATNSQHIDQVLSFYFPRA